LASGRITLIDISKGRRWLCTQRLVLISLCMERASPLAPLAGHRSGRTKAVRVVLQLVFGG
jgi:hypothetical protein